MSSPQRFHRHRRRLVIVESPSSSTSSDNQSSDESFVFHDSARKNKEITNTRGNIHDDLLDNTSSDENKSSDDDDVKCLGLSMGQMEISIKGGSSSLERNDDSIVAKRIDGRQIGDGSIEISVDSHSDDSSIEDFFQSNTSKAKKVVKVPSSKPIIRSVKPSWDRRNQRIVEVNSTKNKSYTVTDDSNSVIQWALEHSTNEYVLQLSSNREAIKIRNVPSFRIPGALYKKLFDHQKTGITWMAGLHSQQVGGLLGDDMGMGKTFMTLTLLGGLMRARTIRNALIVAPLSVLRSWEGEANAIIKTCVPQANILVVSSSVGASTRRRRLEEAITCSSGRPYIVITTYGLIGSKPLDFVHESDSWGYVVLDEAHRIKNPSTQVSKSCRRVCRSKSTRRLILTGTPIMNQLKELWALFDFATSGSVLGKLPSFVNRYAKPIEEARDKDADRHTMRIGKKANLELQEKLRPYFLQRLKIDFLADKLPKKHDLVIWTHLSQKQRSMYEKYVDSGESAVASVLSGESTSPLEAVTWLKKLCGHPILVNKAEKGTTNKFEHHDSDLLVRQSSKLQVLVTLIEVLRTTGHRTLIFSQSTRMLDIIERVLFRVNLSRIDGSTGEKDRQRRVDTFNHRDSGDEVMLLSTKAAGVGLTLTGADRAIIYDPSWNPAEDSQAVDRCYRIGQTKEVIVFRFIAAGTVEEKMYEKQVHKDGIRRAVMTSAGNETQRYFERSELRKLFTLAPPGHCGVLERVQERRQAPLDYSGEGIISSHRGVVGVSSHDSLYSGDSFVSLLDDEKTTQENPFSSASAPIPKSILYDRRNIEDGPPKSNTEDSRPKVLGRSQRILLNQQEKLSDRMARPPKKVDANAVLRQVDEMHASQDLPLALKLLMDILDDHNELLGKDIKLKVHERMAVIANKMGWI